MTGKTERGCLRTMKPLDEFYFDCVDYIKYHYKLDEDVAYNIVDDALIYELEKYPDEAEFALMHKAEQLAQNYIRDHKNDPFNQSYIFKDKETGKEFENTNIKHYEDDYSIFEFNEWYDELDDIDKTICDYRIEGYSMVEIADKLGVSKQAVSKRIKKMKTSVDLL